MTTRSGKRLRDLNNQKSQYHQYAHRMENGREVSIEKADAFAQHLAEVFTPHPVEAHSEEEEDEIHRPLNEPYQLELPLHNFKKNEVAKIIRNNLNPKKDMT